MHLDESSWKKDTWTCEEWNGRFLYRPRKIREPATLYQDAPVELIDHIILTFSCSTGDFREAASRSVQIKLGGNHVTKLERRELGSGVCLRGT